jgi:hypothetical protein
MASNPFDQFDASSESNPFDQFDASEAISPASPKPSLSERVFGTKDQWTSPEAWKRSLGLAARVPVDAITSLPLLAADAGVAARNAVQGNIRWLPEWMSGPDDPSVQRGTPYESPSQMYQQAMGAVAPTPTGGIEKGMNIAGQMVLGSKVPAPQAAQQAPANFSAQTMRQLALQNAQQAGYKVPPSTVNPSVMNKILESAGGKIAMEQDASLKNQEMTNMLARRALGMSDDEMLSAGSLEAVRQKAGQIYSDIAKTGGVKVDQKYIDTLSKLPKAVTDEIAPKVSAKVDSAAGGMMRRGYEEMPPSQVLQSVRELRFEAQRNLSPMAAQNPESAKLGRAQKAAADALEELLMRHLRSSGAGKLADQFADARKLIAKTHTVEDALNEVTGDVNATKLAQQLAKGAPLSGDLKKIAEFSTAFPKASKLVLDSGSVRNTDVALGAGTAALSREPTYLIYPFLRQAVRAGLLSDTGQRALTTPGMQPHPSAAMSMLYGIGAPGLLGQ